MEIFGVIVSKKYLTEIKFIFGHYLWETYSLKSSLQLEEIGACRVLFRYLQYIYAMFFLNRYFEKGIWLSF